MIKPADIQYTGQFGPQNRLALVAKVQAALSPARFAHVLRVEETAVELAQANGVNLEQASIAGLTHDYAKERPDQDFQALLATGDYDPALATAGNEIWHGILGATLIQQELGVTDEEILTAIRQHTVGGVTMTPLSQVLYQADYIEPGRDFPGVATARQLTARSLALGVAYQTWHTLSYLVTQGVAVYPATLATYNAWVPSKRKEFEINE